MIAWVRYLGALSLPGDAPTIGAKPSRLEADVHTSLELAEHGYIRITRHHPGGVCVRLLPPHRVEEIEEEEPQALEEPIEATAAALPWLSPQLWEPEHMAAEPEPEPPLPPTADDWQAMAQAHLDADIAPGDTMPSPAPEPKTMSRAERRRQKRRKT